MKKEIEASNHSLVSRVYLGIFGVLFSGGFLALIFGFILPDCTLRSVAQVLFPVIVLLAIIVAKISPD